MALTSRHSLFSQRLDRAVFASYFVGGVVPIGAFAFVVQRYVLPSVRENELALAGWLAVCVSLGVLSLCVFLALRVITRRALSRMTSDNQRLSVLLGASADFATETQAEAVLGCLASRVAALAPEAGVGLLFARESGKPLELKHCAGLPEAWWRERAEPLRELVAEATASGGASAGSADDGRAWVVLPLAASGAGVGAVALAARREGLSPETIDAVSTLVGMGSAALRRGDLEDAQRNFFAHITELLVSALDAHVVEREGHALGVARIANRLAHAVGLSPDRIERLHFAAMLHDIGLLKFEQTRHRDPKALRLHPAVGARMLARIRLWEPIAPIVLAHHEWWDGSGYPDGLAGEAIPLEARILALADAVDAMGRPKVRRAEPLSLAEIVEEVTRGRGTQFDPALVDAFLGLHERGELPL